MTVQVQSSVEITTSGLILDGEEQVLLCASLFYFRMPREAWAARLAQVAGSGYQVIDVYLPWNFHEMSPGEWDFSGRRDVGAFLDMAHEAGLKVVARPGPYICSEWDGGALPAWLTLTEGLQVRQAEPTYLAEVGRWFDRVLPLLAERQHGRGGSVVAVQLENELDFFDTTDRAAYITALRDMALGHGITVPLVACAGQGDLTGATGGVPGVVPAFNFYPDDRSAFVEPEVRRYTELLAAQGLPLLVTETNRAHVTLRRLLVSGARLLAPYLQASGYNFGYYPSTGNWGDPGGFMSHDYDFGGYLSPIGEPRPEMVQARALAGVVRTLGPRLTQAAAVEAVGDYATDAPTSASPSRLELAGGGSLLGLTNLGEDPSHATLPASGPVPGITLDLPPMSCTLVLRDLPLGGFGLPGTLLLATGDLVGADAAGLQLVASCAGVVVLGGPAVDGEDGEVAVVELPAPAPGAPVLRTVTSGTASWQVVVRHPDDPATGAAAPTAAAEPVRIETGSLLDLPTRSGPVSEHDTPPSSEAVGVFRGRTHYAADVSDVDELVIEGAGDIVDLSLDGSALPSVARFGATQTVLVEAASRLDATVETWGHANFDDVRMPGLRIGALRGLGTVWSVTARWDVSALWTVDAGDQWAGDPAPLRSLGGWSSTRVGQPITYRRALALDADHHHVLQLDGLSHAVHVDVDGLRHLVTPQDPWLHLAPGHGADISVTAPYGAGSLGTPWVRRLVPVRDWTVQAQRDVEIVDLAGRAAPAVETTLPLRLEPGEESWLEVALPAGGCSVRFEGAQVRVSAFAHGELLGRVWLDDPARPRFTGGDAGRIWLPAAWNGGRMRLLLHATAGPDVPALSALLVTRSQE